jgi:hypothetical protein
MVTANSVGPRTGDAVVGDDDGCGGGGGEDDDDRSVGDEKSG